MDRTDARTLFDNILRIAMQFRIQEKKEVPLTFLLVMPDGSLAHVPNIPEIDVGQMAKFIRDASRRVGARYVVSTCEAWMSTREPKVDGPAPSEDPDRVEVLMATIDGPDLQLMGTVEIRPDGTLGEPHVHETTKGRFTNLSGLAEITELDN